MRQSREERTGRGWRGRKRSRRGALIAHGPSGVDAEEGGYRLRRGERRVWPPARRAYGGQCSASWPQSAGRRPCAVGGVASAGPVMLTLGPAGRGRISTPTTFPPMGGMPGPIRGARLADQRPGLSLVALVLPSSLTNRRYGPDLCLRAASVGDDGDLAGPGLQSAGYWNTGWVHRRC